MSCATSFRRESTSQPRKGAMEQRTPYAARPLIHRCFGLRLRCLRQLPWRPPQRTPQGGRLPTLVVIVLSFRIKIANSDLSGRLANA